MDECPRHGIDKADIDAVINLLQTCIFHTCMACGTDTDMDIDEPEPVEDKQDA